MTGADTGMKAIILDGDVARMTTDFAEVTAAHAAGKRFWVELDERTQAAEVLLADVLKIHPLAVEDTWNDLGLPKVEDFHEYVQVVMHGVREDDVEGEDVPLTLAELDVLIGRDFIVTHAPDEQICAVAPVLTEVMRNPRLLKKGPAWVAHALLDRMVDEYLPVVNRYDVQIEKLEMAILDGSAAESSDVMKQILRIKRSLQMLRRTTIYQSEILDRLARAEFDEIPREAMPFYRDVFDHFARVTELVDTYRELANGLLDAHFSVQSQLMNVQSQQMNEIMKRLTLMSTIVLPLTLIAGIYGMNFEHMPELKLEYGYFTVLAGMAVMAFVIVMYFRHKKWL